MNHIETNVEIKQTEAADGMGRVLIKGSGDLASGIALRLHRAGFRILMTDIAVPTTMWKCSEAAAEQIRLSDGAGQALCDDRAK